MTNVPGMRAIDQKTGRTAGWLLSALGLALVGVVGTSLNPNQVLRDAFLNAAESGNEGQIRALLAKNSRLINIRNSSGETRLHLAAKQGHLEQDGVVQALRKQDGA